MVAPEGVEQIRGALTISALLISTVRAADAMARRKTRQKSSGKKVLDDASSLQATPTLCYRTKCEHCRRDDARAGSLEPIFGLAASFDATIFAILPQTKPTSANEANQERLMKTMLEDERTTLRRICVLISL
jgi:hypothetical protein